MSSFSASQSDVPQDYRKVRVLANLGALFDWPGVSVPFYNVPRSMLPFPLQRLHPRMPLELSQPPVPHLQTTSNTNTALTTNSLYFPSYLSPSQIPSRELTPSSTTSTTPEVYSALNPHTINYIQVPTQQHWNANEVVATQQVAPVPSAGNGNGQSAPPPKHCAVDNATTTAGPIRGSTRGQRQTPYMRPAASTSSDDTITLASGCRLSALAISRLTIQGICRIRGCGEIFAFGDDYRNHVRDIHHIMQGKNGNQQFQCPWEGCGEFKSKASLSNHLLGHNTRSGCGLCDEVITGARSDSVQKHYRIRHRDTHENVSIPSHKRTEYSYLFFCEGV